MKEKQHDGKSIKTPNLQETLLGEKLRKLLHTQRLTSEDQQSTLVTRSPLPDTVPNPKDT